MARSVAFPCRQGKNTFSASKSTPLNVENLRQISGLGTICPRWPAAEFSEVGRELAGEFDTRTLACVYIMKTHFIIAILTRYPYVGTGPAGTRGRRHRRLR
jgi:hypothetical protein